MKIRICVELKFLKPICLTLPYPTSCVNQTVFKYQAKYYSLFYHLDQFLFFQPSVN
jgi:hypothetical protein